MVSSNLFQVNSCKKKKVFIAKVSLSMRFVMFAGAFLTFRPRLRAQLGAGLINQDRTRQWTRFYHSAFVFAGDWPTLFS